MSEPELKPCAHCDAQPEAPYKNNVGELYAKITHHESCIFAIKNRDQWISGSAFTAWNTRAATAVEWQPIENADKNNTWQVVARFDGNEMLWWHRAHFKGQCWRMEGGTCGPTHYLPLPLPPVTPKQE